MRMILLILFAALFVVSASILIAQAVQNKHDKEADDLASYLAGLTGDTTVEPPVSSDPGTEPGTEPGVDPGMDPGTEPGTVPVDPGTADTDPVIDPPETTPVDTKKPDDTTNKTDDTTKKPSDTTKTPAVDNGPSQGNNKDPGSVNIEALKQRNKDVCGWIYINGPSVNYPLIHYKDNEYYLRRNWLGQQSNPGCIMVEALNKPDFSEFNTIIYGHNIRANTFFGQLDNYLGGEAGKWNYSKGYEFWKKYPTIKIYTEKEILTYKIYAVYITSTTSTTFTVGQKGSEAKQRYIDYGIKNSVYDTGLVPTVNDRVITLSTCDNTGSYDNRIIIQAYLTNSASR